MGKTHRNIEHVGYFRYMKTFAFQRESYRAFQELKEEGFLGHPGRLRQQAYRMKYEYPDAHDDLPVAALAEVIERGPDVLRVWYPGGEETQVTIDEFSSYVERCHAQGVEKIEVWWGNSLAVLTRRNIGWGEGWRFDEIQGSVSWGRLEDELRPAIDYVDNDVPSDPISRLREKPSASTVIFLRDRSSGLIAIHEYVNRGGSLKASDLVGAVVTLGRTYTLDLKQMREVFGTRTRKGRFIYTFWYDGDNGRLSLHID